MIFNKFKYHKIYLPAIITIWLGLFIDSKEISNYIPFNQWLTNIIVLINFIYIFKNSSHKIKKLLLYGLMLGLLGESFFCLFLGMYTYRLENLPIYVPFGHSIVYACVYYISKEPIIKSKQHTIIPLLFISMVIFSFVWLFLKNDIFGFICFLFIVYLLYKKIKDHLFYLVMYFIILYLELLGTYYNCWIYPNTWFNKIDLITSANPPSSISIFYYGFDLGCLWIYKQFNKRQWDRLKRLRIIKNKTS